MKSGNLNFLEPSGPLQACNGTDLPLPFTSNVISRQFYDYAAICLSFHFDLVPLQTFILCLLRTSDATIK